MAELQRKRGRSALTARAKNSANETTFDIVKDTLVEDGLLSLPSGYVSEKDDRKSCFSRRCLVISIIFGAFIVNAKINKFGFTTKGHIMSKVANNRCLEAAKVKAMDAGYEEFEHVVQKYPSLGEPDLALQNAAPILAKEYGKLPVVTLFFLKI